MLWALRFLGAAKDDSVRGFLTLPCLQSLK